MRCLQNWNIEMPGRKMSTKNNVKHEDFETRLCMYFYEEKSTEEQKTSMKYVVLADAETTVKHADFARPIYPHFYERNVAKEAGAGSQST